MHVSVPLLCMAPLVHFYDCNGYNFNNSFFNENTDIVGIIGSWKLRNLVLLFCVLRICEHKLNWHTNQVWLLLPSYLLAKVLLQMLHLPCLRNKYILLLILFPEIFAMDSLEKWRLDFSWRIINSAIFVKQKKTCLLKLQWNVVFLLIII